MAFQGQGETITRAQATQLAGAIRSCVWHLREAGIEALAVQLDRLFGFATAFGVPGDRKAAAAFYAPLAKIPPDLLVKAFDTVLNAKRDSYRLPLPSEIESVIAEDWGIRKRVKARLEMMQRAPVSGARTSRKDDLAFIAAMEQWEKTKAELAAKSQAVKG